MKRITEAEALRIAQLARITISEGKAELTADELSSVLDFVDALQSVDTEGAAETSQVTGLVDVLREDVVRPSSISREDFLRLAPDHVDGYIKVKRVLK